MPERRMRTVYLAWRHPNMRWHPVGELRHDGKAYRFRYVMGSVPAEEAGLRPLVEFGHFEREYVSPTLFATFENRIPSPTHPRYSAYMEWLHLPADARPMDVLARSGGQRATDMFEVFPRPEPDDRGCYVAHAFIHGLQHRPADARARALALTTGEQLDLSPEPRNEVDDLAIRTETREHEHIGYVPRYLAKDLHDLGLERVSIHVERVNKPPVPMQFWVLCRLEAPWRAGFDPCAVEEFQPRTAGHPSVGSRREA